ncbi:MAG: undecaprenyl-diphosphate phosphatase [Pseudomonadota bacterium]
MSWMQVITLAIVQGITEFLPISSSAHLILIPSLTGWPDQGLAFDVAVHVGTLFAVIWYFRKKLWLMLHSIVALCFTSQSTKDANNARLVGYIIIATFPVGILGFLINLLIGSNLRYPHLIIVTTIGFGIVLWLADVLGRRQKTLQQMNVWQSLSIGLAQAIALIPGTSRSGITITAGLFLGFKRKAAAEFSFLLSIPVIFFAGLLKLVELMQSPQAVDWGSIIAGTLISAVSAYICITLFLRVIEKIGMRWFALYRIFLGLFLLFMLS